MKRFVIAAAVAIAASLAMPNVVLAKGGGWHGDGGGYGGVAMGPGYGYPHSYGYPPGWYHGRKVGWRGRGCPPGLWKQGRC
jgi:hypothetical protein